MPVTIVGVEDDEVVLLVVVTSELVAVMVGRATGRGWPML